MDRRAFICAVAGGLPAPLPGARDLAAADDDLGPPAPR